MATSNVDLSASAEGSTEHTTTVLTHVTTTTITPEESTTYVTLTNPPVTLTSASFRDSTLQPDSPEASVSVLPSTSIVYFTPTTTIITTASGTDSTNILPYPGTVQVNDRAGLIAATVPIYAIFVILLVVALCWENRRDKLSQGRREGNPHWERESDRGGNHRAGEQDIELRRSK